MADNTLIEWADATVNAVNGCSVVSPGCTNCYAMRLAGTRMQRHPSRAGLTQHSKAGPVWTGEVRLNEKALLQPLRWKRPRRIFWNAHGDLFHPAVPDEWIDRVFAVCALTPQHTHQILTKRPERMREYLAERNGMGNAKLCRAINAIPREFGNRHGALSLPLLNVWLGVSVEDQQRADDRREAFASTPAAIKFVSYEPALSMVDWTGWEFVDQIIGGGESGPRARPPHPDWFRATRDFCAANDIAYFHKQWGEWAPIEHVADPGGLECADLMPDGMRVVHSNSLTTRMVRVGKKAAGRLLDGVEHNAMPEARNG